MSYAYSFKYIVLGEAGVGKSSLRAAFGGGSFNPRHDMTIGIEFDSKIVEVAGLPVRISIYDTPGNSKFRRLAKPYYRSLACVLVVYDVTRRETFLAVQDWIEDARRNTRDDIVVVLVGNKRDRDDKRVVGFSEGQDCAAANGCVFIETSARTSENLDQLFIDSGALVYEKLLSGHIDPNNDFHGVQIGDIKDPRYIRGGRAGGGRLASASTADSSTSRCSCCIVS